MSIFSLDESVVVESVRAVSPGDTAGLGVGGSDSPGGAGGLGGGGLPGAGGRSWSGERDEGNLTGGDNPSDDVRAVVAERFARATWSGIAEPGDSLAGLLVGSLGATAALSALVEQRPSAQILDELAATGASDVVPVELSNALERWKPRLIASSALTTLRLAARCSARLVLPGDAEWPTLVDDLGPHAPLALWMRGRPGAAHGLANAIAIVGARAATGYGEHMAMEIGSGLADRGLGVVSGAAYGIDGMAHRSALASSGQTYAFLAGGVDRFYPAGHDALLTRIAREGVVLSELPCGAAPTKWRFLQRNRLIAAAAQATVVVEAGIRSGSLNTAAHAAALGRPLGAVPGPVTSLSSAGCHRLLREYDAVCVTTPDEVVDLVDPALRAPSTPRMRELDGLREPDGRTGSRAAAVGSTGSRSSRAGERARPVRRTADQVRVLDALSRSSPRTTADVARRTGLSEPATQAALGSLGLEGVVHERDAGWCSGEPSLRPRVG